MSSTEFLNQMKIHIKKYENFSLPVLLCDTNLKVHWSNHISKTIMPLSLTPDDLTHIFSELYADRVLAVIETDGVFNAGMLIPFVDAQISLSPIFDSNETTKIIAIAAFFIEKSHIPVAQPLDYVSRTSDAFNYNLRESVHNIFSASDNLLIRADLAKQRWASAFINKIDINCYQILRLSNNLSAYVRLQNHITMPNLTSVNLHNWVDSITPSLKELLKSLEIDLVVKNNTHNLFVPLDAQLFQLAFFNIFHNSIYYTKPGNTITIEIINHDSSIEIVVQDQGVGIPEEVLPYIFDPYFSVSPTSNEVSCVGLGLTLAQRLVELHNGSLKVSSQLGVGTSTHINIPTDSLFRTLILAQNSDSDIDDDLLDKFSPLYTGLTGALATPYFKKDR